MAPVSPQDPGKKRRKVWITIVVAFVVAVLVGRYFTRSVVPIRMATAQRGELVSTLATNGKVEPVNNFAAYSPMAGTVKAVDVHEGDKVKKGQLLLTLDDSVARTNVAAALAAVRGAQAQLQALRQGGTRPQQITLSGKIVTAKARRDQQAATLATLQQLIQQGAASTSEVDAAQRALAADDANLKVLSQQQAQGFTPIDLQHAQANVANAQTAYASALDTLRKENVRAPFDGTIYSVTVRTSDYVQAGDKLLQMADLKQIQILAYFDEPEIGKLAVGESVKIVWAALPTRVWHGHIARTPTTIISYGTRNVGEAIISVDDSDETLLPNTNVTITVTLQDLKNVLLVPREALRVDDRGDFVFGTTGDHLKRIPVKIGALNLTQVQIVSGLDENTVVALSAIDGSTLFGGMSVRRAE